MKVYAISDLHLDYQPNAEWLFGLSRSCYRSDILILAGDISDDTDLLKKCFDHLASTFHQVLFVPGNHELWVLRDQAIDSIEKFNLVKEIALNYGVSMEVFRHQGVSIVPMLSWYDFSFGTPSEEILLSWMDFQLCKWPEGLTPQVITDYFLSMNTKYLEVKDDIVISFSHFLPTINLLPHFVPERFRFIFPVLGTEKLGKQLSVLQPRVHVYGHSHFSQVIQMGGTTYVNNAYGSPNERHIGAKSLLCIVDLENGRGVFSL